ncbi:MAG TPA: hypothetical protein P5555_07745 [Candidatus Paceibacterota bacterium]|nr:hypothetical protein [Verrucomicrobiota bacterium]HRZ45068.1 hypothetical protein [Candidatus Paceibacterota bacterium]
MDTARIRGEVEKAARTFAFVETCSTGDGAMTAKAALQTTAGNIFIVSVSFSNYPSQMPDVWISKPSLPINGPHRYTNGRICYIHPQKWNPGFHDLTFVLGRAAKWLNKYEVWQKTGRWPGTQVQH